ncbi:acyltransferase [Bradyrhizobium jicamae]|uniref:Acyltransferase n=1 Tax=Bradyrhizobium jicamae TaxID=280332 RepID=A0ABS5FYI3_9BRAD|nr:acyltransferase [Bradyrhizobium jicamae]MBR0801833.1 acyltransferase [Bradyrhizobium jicamae]
MFSLPPPRHISTLPAFYLCLALALLLDLPGYRQSWKWHAAQLTNVYVSLHGSWELAWPAAPLWSLNVEEQFYFIWPLIVAATPRRMLPLVFGCIIIVGPLYRLVGSTLDLNEVALGALPPASLDALGAGALLALWPRNVVYWLGGLCAPAAVVAFIPGLDGLWINEFVEFGLLPVFCALILAGYRGALGALQWPPLPALGRVSYGIYLYHMPVLAVAINLGLAPRGRVTLVVCSVVTTAVASLSYLLLERPIRAEVAQRLERAERSVPDHPDESLSPHSMIGVASEARGDNPDVDAAGQDRRV